MGASPYSFHLEAVVKANRSLILSGYALGLFCFVPILETVLALGPPNVGNPDWRFGAVGQFSLNSITPLIGLGVLMALAGWREDGAVMRALSALALLLALLAAGAAMLFTWDMTSVRPRVMADLLGSFDKTAGVSILRLGLTVVVAGLMSWGAWKASRSGTA